MRYAVVLLLLLAVVPSAAARQAFVNQDWPVYGYDPGRSNDGPGFTSIDAGNVGSMVEQQVDAGGTIDSSPIYLGGVTVNGATHDVFFVTTTYGKTDAIDADTGDVLWQFVPASYGALAGTAQITNASPAADPSRTAIYAASPDGIIRKLRVADGTVVWARSITLDATHEKITSSLNVANGLVYATTGGYIGDAPPYQGHVVTLSTATGKLTHVWNSLCADRRSLIDPSSCDSSDSAIWSRSGAAIDPQTGEVVVASGNGPWNGTTDFGDTVAILNPSTLQLKRYWTPANQQQLNDEDLDLGSTSPGFLADGYAVQGGKDATLKLLDLTGRGGTTHRSTDIVQTLPLPGGQMMFSEPAILNATKLFVSTAGGTVAYNLVLTRTRTSITGKLVKAWSNTSGGTSPVLAGGLLYVAGFDGQLHVYQPLTGNQVATLPTGDLHWQSPIVADGRIAMPEGDANAHDTDGVLDIFRLS